MTASREIANGFLFSLWGVGVVRISGFIFNTLLARFLGPSHYGEFFLLLAILQFATMLVDAGFSSGVVRFTALYVGKDDRTKAAETVLTCASVVAALSVPMMVAFFAFRSQIARMLNAPALEWMIPYVIPLFPFLALTPVLLQALQGAQEYKRMILIRDIAEPVIRLSLTAAALTLGFRLAAAVSAHLLGQFFLFTTAAFFLCKRFAPTMHGFVISKEMVSTIAMFSLPLLLSNIAGYLLQWTDTLMLGAFVTANDVGVYGAAQRWASLGGTPLAALTPVFLPVITRFYGANRMDEVCRAYKTITNVLIAAGCLITFVIVSYASPLMSVFGAEFQSTGPMILRLLTVGIFVNLATGPTGALFHMAGRAKLMFYTALALVPLALGLNFFLIKRWGIQGAALGSVLMVSISNITNLIEVLIIERVHPYSVATVKIVFLAFVSVLTSAAARFWSPYPYIFDAFIWLILYPIGVLFWAFSMDRLAYVRKIIFDLLVLHRNSPAKDPL